MSFYRQSGSNHCQINLINNCSSNCEWSTYRFGRKSVKIFRLLHDTFSLEIEMLGMKEVLLEAAI